MRAKTQAQDLNKGIDAQSAMLLAFGWIVALWATLS